jgi:hypothetical protein
MIFNDFNINLALQVVTGDTKLFNEQDENYKNLLIASLHDNNSSTLRELVIMRYLSYTSFDEKHGADGIDTKTGTFIEVKPKYIPLNSKKVGGGGNFNDLTMELLERKKEYNIVCGAIYDLKLVYIVEFPLIEIYPQLKKPIDRAKIRQRVVASFSHTHYKATKLLKVHYLDEDIIYECLTKPHADMLKKRNSNQ